MVYKFEHMELLPKSPVGSIPGVISCVALHKLFYFSEPQFAHLKTKQKQNNKHLEMILQVTFCFFSKVLLLNLLLCNGSTSEFFFPFLISSTGENPDSKISLRMRKPTHLTLWPTTNCMSDAFHKFCNLLDHAVYPWRLTMR